MKLARAARRAKLPPGQMKRSDKRPIDLRDREGDGFKEKWSGDGPGTKIGDWEGWTCAYCRCFTAGYTRGSQLEPIRTTHCLNGHPRTPVGAFVPGGKYSAREMKFIRRWWARLLAELDQALPEPSEVPPGSLGTDWRPRSTRAPSRGTRAATASRPK